MLPSQSPSDCHAAPQITALQSARRLELSMLLRMARGGADDELEQTPKKEGGGQMPLTRRAAGLMAAPRAEVIAPPRDADAAARQDGLYLNPLFGQAPSGPELRGVLINTGGAGAPPAPRLSIRIDGNAPQAPRLSRKLTR
jgi:hypothetical protein